MRHWLTRYRISNALDAGTLPQLLARGHATRCPTCQAFARDLAALHARLHTGAIAAPAPVVARASSLRWLVAAGGGLAFAAAIVVAVVAWPASSMTPPSPPLAALPGDAGIGNVTATAAPMPDVAGQLSALIDRADAPLDHELDDLVADGRRGVGAILATGGLALPQI